MLRDGDVMVAMILLAFFVGFTTGGNARGQAEAPRFEDFPVLAAERLKGRPAAVRLTSPEARRYRTMIRAGARNGPNFAGHYTIVEWGCGAGCAQFEVVDARTGTVYDPPFYVGLRTHFTGGAAQPDPPLEFRIDSKGSASKAHTPPAGSPERKAIMDGLRRDPKAVFKVHYLKVHGDWAWMDVTPLDDKGKAVAEGGASLMHKENGAWKVIDLSVIPEDPDNPMGPDDPDPKFVKAVQKVFPGVPADIFPKTRK